MQSFLECGWAAWGVLLLSLFSMVMALIGLGLAIFKPRWGLWIGVVATGLSLSVPAIGLIGTQLGRQKTDVVLRTVSSVDPDQKERIREVGYAEAGQCTNLGLGFGALPLLLSLAAAGIGLARRGRD